MTSNRSKHQSQKGGARLAGRAPNTKPVHAALERWVEDFAVSFRSLTAATLTLKQGVLAQGGGVTTITVEDCRRTAREFGRALDRRDFGRSARRFKRRLNKVFALERGAGGRWHYHVAIEPPAGVTPEEFEMAIRECWQATEWGYREIEVVPNAGVGWVHYCLKPATKGDLDYWADGIDLVVAK